MKVEIWSDFVCPFCFIGKTYYEQALAQFPHRDRIETIYRSFELDTSEQTGKLTPTVDVLAKKYGMPIEQVKAMQAQITNQAAQAGLTFNFENMMSVNTFDGHRLSVYAQKQGKGKQFTEVLFKAYFTDNAIISDHKILTDVAAQIGLDKAEVDQILQSSKYAEEVRQEEQEASQLGVQGVPFFVFDRKYAVSGAQPVQVFIDTLQRAWSEQSGSLINVQGDANACSIDGSNC